MNKRFLKISTIFLVGVLLTSSCVGSFALFNKVAKWNKQATKSKLLNEIIFILISPVYALCAVADVLVLNTIEFWQDENPLAANVGKTKHVMGKDGKMYAVKTLKDGYEVTTPSGDKIYFVYNKEQKTWSEVKDGKSTELIRFNSDGTVRAMLPDGKSMDVSLNEAGVYQVRMAAYQGYWARR